MTTLDPESVAIPRWSNNGGPRVLVLATSPRLDGNSSALGEALADGAAEAGADVVQVNVTQHVRYMINYCKICRADDGTCSLNDGFDEIFTTLYRPASAVVFATPIWWYGVTAHMKNFQDRIACQISSSTPEGDGCKRDVMGKRMALLLSAEETNFACRMGIITQFSELNRHLRSQFVGTVTGIGNLRGEVVNDPMGPLSEAAQLGGRLFDIEETNYEIDTTAVPASGPKAPRNFPATGDSPPGPRICRQRPSV